MNKQEMLEFSAKIAEDLLYRGVTEKEFKKMSKSDLAYHYPAISDLIEVREDDYEDWAKHNKEEKSLNYFKSLVSFDMVYNLKKKLNLKNADIAGFFDLSESAFKNSSAKDRYITALERFYTYLRNKSLLK